MTQAQIQVHIDAIDQVSKEVLRSKESAIKFLKDIGVIQRKPLHTSRLPNTRKKKK